MMRHTCDCVTALVERPTANGSVVLRSNHCCHPRNKDLFNRFNKILEFTPTEGGAPDLTKLEDKQKMWLLIKELLISFDTAPSNYTKADYMKLLALLGGSLMLLYNYTYQSENWTYPTEEFESLTPELKKELQLKLITEDVLMQLRDVVYTHGGEIETLDLQLLNVLRAFAALSEETRAISQETKQIAEQSNATAENAESIATEAKELSIDAVETAQNIESIATEAKELSIDAVETAQNAVNIANTKVTTIEGSDYIDALRTNGDVTISLTQVAEEYSPDTADASLVTAGFLTEWLQNNIPSGILSFKGVVSCYDDLPVEGNPGDVYLVKYDIISDEYTEETTEDNVEYVWIDLHWEPLGPVLTGYATLKYLQENYATKQELQDLADTLMTADETILAIEEHIDAARGGETISRFTSYALRNNQDDTKLYTPEDWIFALPGTRVYSNIECTEEAGVITLNMSGTCQIDTYPGYYWSGDGSVEYVSKELLATERAVVNEIEQTLSKQIVWDANSNLNNYKTPGIYHFAGYRKNINDNLPIANVDSADKCNVAFTLIVDRKDGYHEGNTSIPDVVSQTLFLGNRQGSETKIYTRHYQYLHHSQTERWEDWKEMLSTTSLGQCSSATDSKINAATENGLYIGYIVNYASIGNSQVFKLEVVNNYALAAMSNSTPTIVQTMFVLGVNGLYDTLVRIAHYQNNAWSFSNWTYYFTKAKVGLSNVDNTSDADKPVSTATQEALTNLLNQSNAYTDSKRYEVQKATQDTLGIVRGGKNTRIDAEGGVNVDYLVCNDLDTDVSDGRLNDKRFSVRPDANIADLTHTYADVVTPQSRIETATGQLNTTMLTDGGRSVYSYNMTAGTNVMAYIFEQSLSEYNRLKQNEYSDYTYSSRCYYDLAPFPYTSGRLELTLTFANAVGYDVALALVGKNDSTLATFTRQSSTVYRAEIRDDFELTEVAPCVVRITAGAIDRNSFQGCVLSMNAYANEGSQTVTNPQALRHTRYEFKKQINYTTGYDDYTRNVALTHDGLVLQARNGSLQARISDDGELVTNIATTADLASVGTKTRTIASATSVTLNPNERTIITSAVGVLSVYFANGTMPADVVREYSLVILAGGNTSVSFGTSITWAGGNAPVWVSGKRYEINICDGLGLFTEF